MYGRAYKRFPRIGYACLSWLPLLELPQLGMAESKEQISDTVVVHRGRIAPLHARRAAEEIPNLFNDPYLRHFATVHQGDNEIGAGNSSMQFILAPLIRRRIQADYGIDLRYKEIRSVGEDPATRTIGHLMLQASLRRRHHSYPIRSVNIHTNTPDTQFKPHIDIVEGYTTSLALTPAVVSVHARDHRIVAEATVNPGDEVEVYSPEELEEREVHSFRPLPGIVRASLVTKYKVPAGYAAIDRIDFSRPDVHSIYFEPHPTES